jgi:hypothetical protein
MVIILLLSCYRQPSIYNEGTAWKMPRSLKVSDFYYDIENIYQYEGRHQEYKLKIKSFFWQDADNENHTIEGVFFLEKYIPTGGDDYTQYNFVYRRYNILKNEPENSDEIRNMWNDERTEIQRGAILYLGNSNNGRYIFGMAHPTSWWCTDGKYESHSFSMYSKKHFGTVLDCLMDERELFKFTFPTENQETNGFQLEDSELELVRTRGNFIELENNTIILTPEELDHLKNELPKLMAYKQKSPKDYIEYAKNELLK